MILSQTAGIRAMLGGAGLPPMFRPYFFHEGENDKPTLEQCSQAEAVVLQVPVLHGCIEMGAPWLRLAGCSCRRMHRVSSNRVCNCSLLCVLSCAFLSSLVNCSRCLESETVECGEAAGVVKIWIVSLMSHE